MSILLLLYLSIMLFCLFPSMESGRERPLSYICPYGLHKPRCDFIISVTFPGAINSQNIFGYDIFSGLQPLGTCFWFLSPYSWQFFKWLMVQALEIQILCLGNAVIFLCLRVIIQRFASEIGMFHFWRLSVPSSMFRRCGISTEVMET